MANPNNQQVRKNRNDVGGYLRTKRPDLNIDDDEELFGAIGDEFDENDAYRSEAEDYRKRHDESDKLINDLFTADKRSAHFFNSWIKEGTPVLGLLRTYGREIRDAIDNPEKLDEIAAAEKEFNDRQAEDERLDREYAENLKKSLEQDSEVMQKNGFTDEQMDAAYGLLIGIAKNVTMGIFASDHIEMAAKALGYDNAVAEAEQQAEIRGRNEQLESKYRGAKQTDGMPRFSGEGGAPQAGQPQKPQMGALDRYDGNQNDIFARGNERKRTRTY